MRPLAELGRDCNGLVDSIEAELCAVEGLEELQAQARKGRTAGARFSWKPAMGDDTAGAAKTTSVSRAWRRTAKWLGSVLQSKVEKHAEAARWKIRFYRHPKPDLAQATQEQNMSFKVFTDWRGAIKHGQLHSRPWLDMLRHVATKQAESEEAAAQLANIKGYIPWVSSGPARGPASPAPVLQSSQCVDGNRTR